MENCIRVFIEGLSNRKLKIQEVVLSLKNNAGYGELTKLTDSNISAVKNNLFWFLGNSFPKTYEDLGKHSMVLEAISLEIEIEWLFLAIRKGYNELNSFLKKKRQYEDMVFIGDYNAAEAILNTIETEICCSLWTLENRLLLSELKGGIIENKKTLQQIAIKLNSDVQFSTIYYSERVELESGVSPYYEKMLASFSEYEGIDKEFLISYFTFKLDPYESDKAIEPKSILQIGFKFSLVDRYLEFIKLCALSTTNDFAFNIDKFIYKLTSLSNRIDDPVLENLLSLKKNSWSSDSSTNLLSVLKIHDLYLEGSYESCYLNCKEILSINPTNFEAIKLYAKSSIHLGKEDFNNREDTLFLKVLKCVRTIYLKNKDSVLLAPLLIKLAYVVEGFNIAFHLINFVAIELYDDHVFLKPAYLYGSADSPNFYRLFDKNHQLNCLEKQRQKFPQEKSFAYYFNILSSNGLENLNLVGKNKIRSQLISIDYLQNNGAYAEAIGALNASISEVEHIGFIFEKFVRRLFECYFKIDDLTNAVDIFIRSYFISPSLTPKLDSTSVIKVNKKHRLQNIMPSILLPIFYSVNNAEDVDIFNALKLFLNSKNVDRPSALKTEYLAEEAKHIVFFLNDVCTNEVLKHSTIFDTPKEIIIERINILHLLQNIDSKNTEIYYNELQTSTKRLIVLDGINKLDESKIYINEEGLYESELKRHEAAYERLVSLITIYKTEMLQEHAVKFLGESLASNLNPITPSLRELFYLIRQQFLFSKYGLVNYLSTRIRHGIFEEAIRPVFEKLNLVTEKNFSGTKYNENKYWLDKIKASVSQEKIERFTTELSSFSKNVDDYILELLTNQLQIKTESRNKEGLFNFTYSDDEIKITDLLNEDVNDFKQFVHGIYNLLWNRNEENLKNIRFFITNKMKNTFDSFLTELENSLLKIVKREIVPELFINTTTCRGNLHAELENISNWFVRSDSLMSDFALSDIIDITNEYLNRSSMTKQIIIDKNLGYNFIVKGKFYVQFSDLLRLFMANALKHSHILGDKVLLKITNFLQDDNILVINITNPIGESVDKSKLKLNIETLKQQYSNIEKLTGERNSGLLKARNIIKSDFNNENNILDYEVTENNEFLIVLKINIKEIML